MCIPSHVGESKCCALLLPNFQLNLGEQDKRRDESTYHWVLTVQRKNWDPLVLGPALAIDRIPGPVCFRVKFSSLNLKVRDNG